MHLEHTTIPSSGDIPEHVIAKAVEAACERFANDIAYDSVRSRDALALNEELGLGLGYATPERLRTLWLALDDHISRAMRNIAPNDKHAAAVVGQSPLIQSLLVTYWHSAQNLQANRS